MAEQRVAVTGVPGFRYANAPIVEAVFEIRAELPGGFDLQRLSEFHDAEYAIKEPSLQLEGNVETSALGVTTHTTQRTNGYRVKTSDGRQIAQLRDNGFGFSRLAPYDQWATFSAEAFRMWNNYRALAGPVKVTRLGLRYINQIALPADESIQIDDYLRTRPEISSEMPQTLNGYFLIMDIPLPKFEAMCRITETVRPQAENGPALVLDIDVGYEYELDPRDDKTLARYFNRLRDAKNLVFEASITETSRRLFT